MITYFAAIDRRNVIGKELFPLFGLLQKNRAVFEYNTRGNIFIINDPIYTELLNEQTIPGHITVVVDPFL